MIALNRMSADPVISAQNVSKAYRIWGSPAARLTAPLQESLAGMLPAPAGRWLQNSAARSYRDFWALKDISFEVKQGEAVGIIGRNGSGKSTLLQIIAGTLQPTVGTVNVRGRVAALLELGSGFNPEFTGRENVYMNGAVLGLSRPEIDARFDAIAAFADIGEFIEQPTKIYSSGMVVRLAFAVCAHVDAHILIIDEALSVGDARFQLKCARTIDRFLEEGRTLLFVSHDMNSVKRLCNCALLLEEGRMLFRGRPNTVVNLYSKLLAGTNGAAAIADDLDRLACEGEPGPTIPPPAPRASEVRPFAELAPTDVPTDDLRRRLDLVQSQLEGIAAAARPDPRLDRLQESERAGQKPAGAEYDYGGELGRIEQRTMRGADGTEKTVFTSGETVEIRLLVKAHETFAAPIYALTLKNTQGQDIYGTNTLYNRQTAPPIKAGESAFVVFRFPLNLVAGEYFASLGWTQLMGNELLVIHRRYDSIKFTVLGVDRTFGLAHLFATIRVEGQPAGPA
jgi:lipopolysaccharide transport system ATP-binding protein